jgi:hypothetical protein
MITAGGSESLPESSGGDGGVISFLFGLGIVFVLCGKVSNSSPRIRLR